jgi:hypothetical protein
LIFDNFQFEEYYIELTLVDDYINQFAALKFDRINAGNQRKQMGHALRYFRSMVGVRHCNLHIHIGKEGILLELLQEAENRQVQIAE